MMVTFYLCHCLRLIFRSPAFCLLGRRFHIGIANFNRDTDIRLIEFRHCQRNAFFMRGIPKARMMFRQLEDASGT